MAAGKNDRSQVMVVLGEEKAGGGDGVSVSVNGSEGDGVSVVPEGGTGMGLGGRRTGTGVQVGGIRVGGGGRTQEEFSQLSS